MKKITQSKEDYLRVLLKLSKEDERIHSMDIANALGLSRASVSRMMNLLKDSGYVMKEKYSTISLTEKGLLVAERLRKRRNLLKDFLTDVLGVEALIAEEDACRMEHIISEETEIKLNLHLKECQFKRGQIS